MTLRVMVENVGGYVVTVYDEYGELVRAKGYDRASVIEVAKRRALDRLEDEVDKGKVKFVEYDIAESAAEAKENGTR